MRYRKLRIAWSVFCGIACVLLVVLWVRSYWWEDRFSAMLPASQRFAGISLRGQLAFAVDTTVSAPYIDSRAVTVRVSRKTGQLVKSTGKRWVCHNCFINVPHWYYVIPIVVTAIVPWIRWRFNLRTLLIATTLIACVLGLIVWGLRQ
jgi:hypothetical protein